jgi:hypothetical protein
MNTVPSTSAPTTTALVLSALRSLLMLGSSLGIYHGAVDDATLTMWASVIVALGTAAWSLVDKFQAARKQHAAAVASAGARKAVVPQ